jgi:hypothetical protein
MELCGSAPVIAEECEWQFRPWIRSAKTEARCAPVGRASLLRIDRELTYATRQPTSLIEVLPRILPARSFAGVQPDADQMFL